MSVAADLVSSPVDGLVDTALVDGPAGGLVDYFVGGLEEGLEDDLEEGLEDDLADGHVG